MTNRVKRAADILLDKHFQLMAGASGTCDCGVYDCFFWLHGARDIWTIFRVFCCYGIAIISLIVGKQIIKKFWWFLRKAEFKCVDSIQNLQFTGNSNATVFCSQLILTLNPVFL